MYIPSIFSNHMVLQRGIRLPVWGWDDVGREVTVNLGLQSAKTTVPDGGFWQITLDPIELGPPLHMTIGNGETEVIFENIVAGDVWVCSGQSNMGWPLCESDGSEQAIACSDHSNIRLFDVPPASSKDRQVDIDQTWQVCRPESAWCFSATGYWFGKAIHEAVATPIGLINSAVGGSPINCWIDRRVLEEDADFRPILDRYDSARAHVRAALSEYELGKAKAQLHNIPLTLAKPNDPQQGKGVPGGLFNAMVAPYIPFAIRGVIWYQGESNVLRAYQYRKLFAAMIDDWRNRWGQGDFPFLFMQLPNYDQSGEQHRDCWPELRDAQQAVLASAHTAMAVTIDIGDSRNIHPSNKKQFADRLANVALREVYGREAAVYGPRYLRHQTEGAAAHVHFSDVEGGLSTSDQEPVREFTVAGGNRRFAAAKARIENDHIVVQSDQVPDPIAVRYAWSNDPRCNLVNTTGLPAAPFRTDDWPGKTHSAR